jgi:hypothetical protein
MFGETERRPPLDVVSPWWLATSGAEPTLVDQTLDTVTEREVAEVALTLGSALHRLAATQDAVSRRRLVTLAHEVMAAVLATAMTTPRVMPLIAQAVGPHLLAHHEALAQSVAALLKRGHGLASVADGLRRLLQATERWNGDGIGLLEEFVALLHHLALREPLRDPAPGPRRAALLLTLVVARVQADFDQDVATEILRGTGGLARSQIVRFDDTRLARASTRLEGLQAVFPMGRGRHWLHQLRDRAVRDRAQTTRTRDRRRRLNPARRRPVAAHDRVSAARSPGGDADDPPADPPRRARRPTVVLSLSPSSPASPPLFDRASLCPSEWT